MAGARKLAVIGWMMLKSNEPYRYAIPKSTETKLAKLRVNATGERRKGGAGKGVKAAAKLPGGSRTVKSLAQVLASEGLPEPRPLSHGEQRTVAAADCQAYVDHSATPHVGRDPRAADARAANMPWPTSQSPRQRLHRDPAAMSPPAAVRVPLLCFLGLIMAAIDYRAHALKLALMPF